MAVETRFPRWADNPPQFLIWEVDELSFVALFFMLFLPTRNLIPGLIIGIILMRIYRKLKEKLPSYFYLHYMWFWGLWKPKCKNTHAPKGYLTRYRE
jgi:conjugal transfer pilus assembly protein TraL